MKPAKVTFKNEPRLTGLYAVGNRAGAEIKVGGKRVGTIIGSSWHRPCGIQIAVKSSESIAGWTWVMPKKAFQSRDDAKAWVKENFDQIVAGRELHYFDD